MRTAVRRLGLGLLFACAATVVAAQPVVPETGDASSFAAQAHPEDLAKGTVQLLAPAQLGLDEVFFRAPLPLANRGDSPHPANAPLLLLLAALLAMAGPRLRRRF